MKYAVLDFETTGMSAERDEIIQVGLVMLDETGIVTGTTSSFVRPTKPIPKEITRLTGITDADVQDAPELEEVLQQLVPQLQDAVLVGHNVGFDASFLQAALDEGGYLPFAGRMLDTLEMARLLYPTQSSYSLISLTDSLGIVHDRPHQADSDTMATAELFLRCLSKMRLLPLFTLQRLQGLFDPDASDLGWLIAAAAEWRQAQPQLQEEDVQHFRQFALKVGDWSDEESAGDRQERAAALMGEMTFEQYVNTVERNLKERLPGYETREGQSIMVREVMDALDANAHLLVEAGTGTGKSLGYLLPALYYGLKHAEKIVVSTHTIQLQEQLRQRDLPLLQEVLPMPFHAAVLKGRSNYLCLRKFENRQSVPEHALSKEESIVRGAMTVWLGETLSGESEELDISGRGKEEWDIVAGDAASCLNRACPWFRKCFYHRARNDAGKADLIITNHALLFTDMRAEHRVLPTYDRLVVDEAHHLEEVASSHLGHKTGHASLALPLSRLWKDARSGLLPQLLSALAGTDTDDATVWAERLEELIPKITLLREAWERWMDASFGLLAALTAADEAGNMTYRMKATELPDGWESYLVDGNNVIQLLSDLIRPLEKFATDMREQTEELTMTAMVTDLSGALKDLQAIRTDIQSFMSLGDPAFVYWIEGNTQYRGRSIWIYGAPVDVSGLLKEGMFDKRSSIVMTSATLTISKDFGYVTEQLGLSAAGRDGKLKTAMLPSPFNYRKQSLVLIPRDFPTIKGREGEVKYIEALTKSLHEVAMTVGGRMLVLFTSHRMLRAVYGPLKDMLELQQIQVLGQGIDGGNRSRLTKQFINNPASILLGTSSFWEGIDLPGDLLTCLAIVRLPFQPPNHPVSEVRAERLQAEGKNPFMKLSLPQAVIKFKQGFGRLVRTSSDKGVVILYDTRVIDAYYGKHFLYSLPGPKMEHLPLANMTNRIREWFDKPESTDPAFKEGNEA